MATMSDTELRAFLAGGTRTVKLATVRPDGSPHVAPVWFLVDDDGSLVFMTGRGTSKGRALLRDPRVCACVDDDTPPFAFAMIHGVATLSEDLDEMLVWSIRIAHRYMGADLAEAFGRRNAVPGELLVRITPTHTVALKNLSE